MSEHEDRGASREKGFVVEVPGLPPVRFLGWRSTHAKVRIAAFSKEVNRAVIEARASISGSLRSAGAVLRPGDTFDRETGKKLALARLVEALVPDCVGGVREKKQKALRSRLFLEIWRRTHKGKMPKRAGRTYDISSHLDHLRLHQNLASLWLPLVPGKKDAQVSVDVESGTVPSNVQSAIEIASETLRGGGIPRGPLQGQTASTVIFDEISKWPSPEAPDMKKPPSPEEAKS